MKGQKHLVKCRCVLPQYKYTPNPPAHQFVVFSTIKDDDTPNVKYAQCNNCGLIHKVIDICKSEIISNKEDMGSLISINDIKMSLPNNLIDILERNYADLASWENAQFIIDNKMWGSFIVLAQEDESDTRQIKYLRIMSDTSFKVETSFRSEVLTHPE